MNPEEEPSSSQSSTFSVASQKKTQNTLTDFQPSPVSIQNSGQSPFRKSRSRALSNKDNQEIPIISSCPSDDLPPSQMSSKSDNSQGLENYNSSLFSIGTSSVDTNKLSLFGNNNNNNNNKPANVNNITDFDFTSASSSTPSSPKKRFCDSLGLHGKPKRIRARPTFPPPPPPHTSASSNQGSMEQTGLAPSQIQPNASIEGPLNQDLMVPVDPLTLKI